MEISLTTPRLISVDFDPFAQGVIEKTVRLTESQTEIWTSCLIGGMEANCAYNESISLVLQGAFSLDAMSRALEDVVTRHEALRSTISADGENMCIHADANFLLHIDDLSKYEESAQNTWLDRYATDDAEKPFNLKDGPLFRAAIFKLDECKHHVRLTAHHIVCDGWSFGIILEDLAALYSAHAQSIKPNMEAPTGFADYVNYLTEFGTSDEYKQTENYWVGQYKKPYSTIEIPIDFPRPPQRTYQSDRVDFLLDKTLVESLSSMGKAHNASLVTVLLTAFEAYMHRLSAQEDIVIGLAASGQLASGYPNLVGHCVHLLPIRSKPSGNVPYADYLRRRV